MLREPISTRSHGRGELVADVYRGHAGENEFFSYTFSGPAVGESSTFWNVESQSKEQAQEAADRRVTEEYRLRDIDHHCSPDECSQWIDAAARTPLQLPGAGSSPLGRVGTTVANQQAQEVVGDDAEVVRQDAEQTRDVTEARRVQAEAARTVAEHVRTIAEGARELQEQHRQELEALRQEREALRQAAEDARHAAEEARDATIASVAATADALSANLAQMQFLEEGRQILAQVKTRNPGDIR